MTTCQAVMVAAAALANPGPVYGGQAFQVTWHGAQ